MPSQLKSLKRSYRPYTKRVIFYILFLLISSACHAAIIYWTGRIGDLAVTFAVRELIFCLAIISGLSILETLLDMLSSQFAKRFEGSVGHALRGRLLRDILAAPYKKLVQNSSGSYLTIYTRDLSSGSAFLSSEMYSFIAGVLLFVVSTAFMAYLQPLLTGAFIVLATALSVLQVAVSKPIAKHTVSAAQRIADYNAIIFDSLQNTSLAIAYGLEEILEKRCQKSYEKYFEASRKRLLAYVRLIITSQFISYCPILFAYVACGLRVAGGRMTPGEFLTFTAMLNVSNSFLLTLSQNLSMMRTDGEHLKRYEECLANLNESCQSLGNRAEEPLFSDEVILDFSDVHFSYGDTPVLSGTSFQIFQGEKIALVGANGAGKSTILKLIIGLYAPNKGVIKLFGKAIARNDTLAYRKRLAYISQEDFVLPGTIRENIIIGREDCAGDEERLTNSARRAGILDEIRTLPKGFDTILEDDGQNLSGGQRQRIALARALFRDAPIMLLDEATCALDPATEESILDAALQNTPGKTVLFVTHNDAVTARCDRVLTMESGKIVLPSCGGGAVP